MDMRSWLQAQVASPTKRPMPVLSFPSVGLLGISVLDLISDSDKQAEGMIRIAERCDTSASVSMMDLSVEAECFGSNIRFSAEDVPTVIGGIVGTPEEAAALLVPEVGSGRTGRYIDAIHKAKAGITDRPVLAGVIGPFSLAGRLMDVTQAMLFCYDDPDMVHVVLAKVTRFLTDYAEAYKATGADGVVIAEPLAGLLSPDLAREFSATYVKQIIDAVQTDDFIVVYHNCGGSTIQTIDSILSVGAAAYHFGNAIRMTEMLPLIPAGTPVFGNVDPAGQFCNGTPGSIRENTMALLEACATHPNFIISSGCDIPPRTPWENIDSFFAAVSD
ncbi:MAG: uroporphyrinogen decarboxylase family protein, partial [Propionibacteriaceae bacterium]|nr:uroporphyrinogen decarboxylase family protein [Propionibacteriaceae bacterium]